MKKRRQITLQNLIDFARKNELDPKECVILLHSECANGDIDLDYFQKIFVQKNVKVLNKEDEFEEVKQAISLEQLWIPDFMGN